MKKKKFKYDGSKVYRDLSYKMDERKPRACPVDEFHLPNCLTNKSFNYF